MRSIAPAKSPTKSSPGSRSSARSASRFRPSTAGSAFRRRTTAAPPCCSAAYCGNLTALLSAHQSIGVPQPLILFGTEEQKRRFLPRVAGGEVSAFALTEPKVGSDPAKMETHAEPTDDGSISSSTARSSGARTASKAGVLVVMAKTPPKNGRRPGHGVHRQYRYARRRDRQPLPLHGLKALYNAVVRFHDVKVPRENIILAEGKGLRVALTTLNTGRLTLPAACTGLAKRCLEVRAHWANERVQWGAPIGKHAAIADKIARMAADIFAMEAMTFYTASLVDRDKTRRHPPRGRDVQALGERTRPGSIVDETMQIRGGRGYETAAIARRARRESRSRWSADARRRINTIFEGSSEIMRLFIAREALDPHLHVGAPMLNSQAAAGRARPRRAGRRGLLRPLVSAPVAAAFGGARLHPKLAAHIALGARRHAPPRARALPRHGALRPEARARASAARAFRRSSARSSSPSPPPAPARRASAKPTRSPSPTTSAAPRACGSKPLHGSSTRTTTSRVPLRAASAERRAGVVGARGAEVAERHRGAAPRILTQRFCQRE